MLSAGIVGLPNVGKSTLFNALIRNYKAEAANFPFCTIDPNVGIVNLPDERLETLRKLENSEKIIYAGFEFVDIAGLVKGASEGAGLGNKFLSHIREVDAIVYVIRCFEDKDIHHVDGSIDSIRDFETISFELALSDLTVIKKRIEKIQKNCKAGDKAYQIEEEILKKIEASIENISPIELDNEEKAVIKHLNLLSLKPFLVAANLKEEELAETEKNTQYIKLKNHLPNINVIPVSAKIEAELIELTEEEAKEYLLALNVKESGIKTLIRNAFDTLGLMTYFTVGPKETRAWTIEKNSKAPKAAGAIHSDFERGFIKAEIISFNDFVQCGSKAKAREVGKLRLEGKEYIVQEADIIEFKFNV